ncbi:MAG: thioredoxin domain-containing protein, partial [Candidatus Obscuribacterales bacterium]|nr:thioredoxin domain-containing protein [Candidatus Obscuribacterales bacterium]
MTQTDSGKSGKSNEARRANKLAGETSTYLLQHAHNPVDWYPWGSEALSRAKAEDKPILLSIGYSACHWCHVMEHESFEDESTAEMMNNGFINIKVDREERPDIDEIYMKSVQLLTGHGGWPMTVFLTPELKPFYAGTYFPPQDRHGMPSFKRVLTGVQTAWEGQREDVEESSKDITKHINLLDKGKPGDHLLNENLLDAALDPLLRVFDKTWGGFGGA